MLRSRKWVAWLQLSRCDSGPGGLFLFGDVGDLFSPSPCARIWGHVFSLLSFVSDKIYLSLLSLELGGEVLFLSWGTEMKYTVLWPAWGAQALSLCQGIRTPFKNNGAVSTSQAYCIRLHPSHWIVLKEMLWTSHLWDPATEDRCIVPFSSLHPFSSILCRGFTQ